MSFLPLSFKLEKWRIYEAYLNYAFESGWAQADTPEVDVFRKKFNLNKFLNEVPVYSKDKRGANVSILVLQVLFFLERGELDRVVAMTETLKKYAGRYLRTDENKRSQAFFRMLLMLERYNFDPDKVEKAARRYFEELSTPDPVYGQFEGAEVIPYDMLWPRVLLRLRRMQEEGTIVQKPVRTSHKKQTEPQ